MNVENFEKVGDTYAAAGMVLKKLDENDNIKFIRHPRESYGYYVNDERKTAMFSKCIARVSTPMFRKRVYRKSKNIYDTSNRISTTGVGKVAITYFMNNELFSDYSLVVDCGSLSHEVCIFFKKINGSLHAIYFNPSFSDIHDGAASSYVVATLLRSFGNAIYSIQAYYSPTGNVASNCAGIAWEEIYNHIWGGVSPFDRDDITLADYSKLCTLHTYQTHWLKNGPSKPPEYYKMWEDFDGRLANIKTPIVLAAITNDISNLTRKYMHKKLLNM